MHYKLIVFIFILTFFSCQHTVKTKKTVEKGNYKTYIPLSKGLLSSLDSITIQSITTPILKGKEANLILSWNFDVKTAQTPIYVRGLSFKLKDSEDLTDFAKFSVVCKNAKGETAFFDSITKIEADSLLSFSGKIALKEGVNSFELYGKLSPNANIYNQLKIKPSSMTLGGKRYDLEVATLQRKLGIAFLQHGEHGVDTYRIPGLVTTEKGTLIAVYDMRHNSSKDLQEDIDVGMSRSTDGGQTWHSPIEIMDMGEYRNKPEKRNGVGDPSILYDKVNNTLWVAGLWMHGISEKEASWWGSKEGLTPQKTGQLLLVKSTNDGKTWSSPINITSQVKKPKWQLLLQGPGRGITIGDSILVFPAQFKAQMQQPAIDGGKYTPFSTIIYSKDAGETWRIGKGAKSNTTEAQVIALNDGSLMLNMRDDRNRKEKGVKNGRAIAITKDFGETWTTHTTSNSTLIEPNCMASLLKEEFILNGEKKSLVLFSNPNSKTARKDLSIKVSFDDAQSWDTKNVTLVDAGLGRGYSCMTKVDDEHIGILYEGSGADLVFQVFHINELVKK